MALIKLGRPRVPTGITGIPGNLLSDSGTCRGENEAGMAG